MEFLIISGNVTKPRAFGSNIIFLQQLFSTSGDIPFSPGDSPRQYTDTAVFETNWNALELMCNSFVASEILHISPCRNLVIYQTTIRKVAEPKINLTPPINPAHTSSRFDCSQTVSYNDVLKCIWISFHFLWLLLKILQSEVTIYCYCCFCYRWSQFFKTFSGKNMQNHRNLLNFLKFRKHKILQFLWKLLYPRETGSVHWLLSNRKYHLSLKRNRWRQRIARPPREILGFHLFATI